MRILSRRFPVGRSLAGPGSERGATLIELMIAVAIVAILSIPVGFVARPAPAVAVADRGHAVALLRSQSARLRALPAAAVAKRDGTPFDADLPGLHRLPNAAGTVRATPYGADGAGLLRVELTLAWERGAGEPHALTVATLRRTQAGRTGGAP